VSRPCRSYGCPALVTNKGQRGFCDEHAHMRAGWSKRPARTGSTTERGYGHAWQKLRLQILTRDAYVCVLCRQANRYVPATDVDHIISKARGGTDAHDNLQSLCSECHKAKTSKEDSQPAILRQI
jgi:5-methylcytosine-specific restriction protein A